MYYLTFFINHGKEKNLLSCCRPNIQAVANNYSKNTIEVVSGL